MTPGAASEIPAKPRKNPSGGGLFGASFSACEITVVKSAANRTIIAPNQHQDLPQQCLHRVASDKFRFASDKVNDQWSNPRADELEALRESRHCFFLCGWFA
jgi:hypothetical protein